MDMIECLMKAGFTRYEAVLYLTLCREGELTGYEAAKISNIPRSNAYLGLAGLVEKGGALRIDGDPSKFAAVPAAELVFNLRKALEEVYTFIEENIPVREAAREQYYTITGRRNVINKMNHMIRYAEKRIYISTSPSELAYVVKELTAARDRGLKVVVITGPGFALEGAVIYHNEKQPGQIRLIVDSAHVLTGEIGGTGEANCLYSKSRNLVQLTKDSLSNEIRLIQIKSGP
jgi:sugar-specific transcriptional regulator TrmB